MNPDKWQTYADAGYQRVQDRYLWQRTAEGYLKIIEQTLEEAEAVRQDFQRGLLTEQEQKERIIELWQDTTSEVADEVRDFMDPAGNLSSMAISGATKGGFGPISQLAGMRGLMADPAGRIIPLPIRSSFRDGLTTLEYFISTHGARKGLTDTALRTADAGYLPGYRRPRTAPGIPVLCD